MKMKFFGIAVGIAIALSACKKNATDEQAFTGNDPATLKAKTWFEKEQSKPITSLQAKHTALRFTDGQPLWDKSKRFYETNELVVPVTHSSKTDNIPAEKYLVLKENATGDIEAGYYLFVLGKNRPAINSALLINSIPASFDGALLKYSIDGVQLSGDHYNNGEMVGLEDKIVTKRHENTESQNIVPVDDGCQTVTVDWYWQTYQNGVLINEVYLFSSTEIICEDGNGGGTSQGASCAEQAINFINAGHAVSILESMDREISLDSLRCTDRPNWKIYTAVTYFIYSYETIVWSRLNKNQAYNFSSYTSRGDAALGTSVGGTRTYTIISKTAMPVGAAGTSVIIEIDFTVRNQPICNYVPVEAVTLGGRANKRFFPPINVVYGN